MPLILGEKALELKGELLFIWDKLQGLIDSGGIHDIIYGNDEIEKPLRVYYVKDGEVRITYTDAFGWPNTTISGELMYENTYFKTLEEGQNNLLYKNIRLQLITLKIE
jgi:hypothetical protein